MVKFLLMSSITAIYPVLPALRASLGRGVGTSPQSLAEVVSAGQPAGAETMMQQLLKIRGEIGGPDKARAEQEASLHEFHAPPITEGGFSPPRMAPARTIDLLA